MDLLGPGLMVVGILAIIVGIVRVRGPLATIRRLDQTAANLERYESWRGKRTSIDPDGRTGADEMRAQMRTQVTLWGGLIAVGAALVLVGFLLR